MVFPNVTCGMSLRPPKTNIINLQILENTIWLFNWFHLFPILSSGDFFLYLEKHLVIKGSPNYSQCTNTFYTLLMLNWIFILWISIVIDINPWCKSFSNEEQRCPVGDVDMLWYRSSMYDKLKWSIAIVDMFSNLRKLLLIPLSLYNNWLNLDHILPMSALSPLILLWKTLKNLDMSILEECSNYLRGSLWEMRFSCIEPLLMIMDLHMYVDCFNEPMLVFLHSDIIFAICILRYCTIPLMCPLAYVVTFFIQLIWFWQFFIQSFSLIVLG